MTISLKVPFDTAKFCRLRNARYLTWRDAFEVEFEDGIAFLEPHATIRKSNKISNSAKPVRVELEDELKHGFFGPVRQRPDCRSLLVIHPRIAAEEFKKVKRPHRPNDAEQPRVCLAGRARI
jgi:hypothetical protein